MNKIKLTREHFEQTKAQNMDLILQSQMNTKMAETVIKMCDKMLEKYPVKGKPLNNRVTRK